MTFFSSNYCLNAQLYDANLVLGDANIVEGQYGARKINFLHERPIIEESLGFRFLTGPSVLSISNNEGEFLFGCNGKDFIDKNWRILNPNQSINQGLILLDAELGSYTSIAGFFALPVDNDSTYHIISGAIDPYDTTAYGLDYSLLLYNQVDFRGGEFKFQIYNDSVILNNTDYSGVVKHANGRDWWVISPQPYTIELVHQDSLLIHVYLLQPDGIHLEHILPNGYNTSFDYFNTFNLTTPDGTKFIDLGREGRIHIYDFDRNTGLLSNYQLVDVETITSISPAARARGMISPNGRFLYYADSPRVLQLDLWAPDISASVEVVYTSTTPNTFFIDMFIPTDGKIYIRNDQYSYHVINYPNLMGAACEVIERGLVYGEFQVFGTTGVPATVNYRLGPIDGSPSDSLGIDNVPLAFFRHRVDSTLTVPFWDASYYEPTDWFWDFGDGGTSTEVDPVHTFPALGAYEVCLTASNDNGSHTFCRTVVIDRTVATKDLRAVTTSMKVYPNPASDKATLRYIAPTGGVKIQVFNQEGKLFGAWETIVNEGTLEIVTSTWASGVYEIVATLPEGKVLRERMVVVQQ